MALIFDSHVHYDDAAFDDDRDAVLRSLPDRGVEGAINCGVDGPSARRCAALAERYPFLFFAAGIHPEQAGAATEEDAQICEELLAHPRAVAVGEIGLDYHYEDACPRERQKDWFARQLGVAVRRDKPVIVHDREAHEDTLTLLRQYHPRGVVHCFSGSVEMAREVIRLGLYIGLGGVVTFKNARKAVEVAADIPLDRLLLETDAPYMAPVPYRGKRCDSAMIALTAARIAEIRGTSPQEVIDQSRENIRALFGV
ncbi:MAG: TatD family hydrolase [Acutalibacteraceae bacterium]|jgi:TatD DNase family protein